MKLVQLGVILAVGESGHENPRRVAIIVLFAVWLQTLRALTPVVAGLLVGLYVFLELAVQFGTRGSVELPVRR